MKPSFARFALNPRPPNPQPCRYDHYDLVLYLISVRARLDLEDSAGRLPLQYAQTQATRDLVARNMRTGEDDKNAIELGADYGYFTWTQTHAAVDTFESANPMRHAKHASSTKAGSSYSMSSSSSASKRQAEASETKEDFFSSAVDFDDHEFASEGDDDDDDDDDDGSNVSDIVAAPGVEDHADASRSATASPTSVTALPPSRTPQNLSFSAANSSQIQGSGNYNAAFYTSLRKEGINSALANRRMSGVSINTTRHHNI